MATIYHIPVCTRCRSKKIKCDTDRPRCRQCARADTTCEFIESIISQNTALSSRDHISALERKLYDLEADYALLMLERKGATETIPSTASEKATLKESTVKELVKIYFSHCQFPYSILLEEEFVKQVDDIYAKHVDPFANSDGIPDKIFFMISMVVAISSLSLTCRTPNAVQLAEYNFKRATSRLNRILHGEKDVALLQCLLLLLLYSTRHYTNLAHPWYFSGIVQQICSDIFLREESSFINRTGIHLTTLSMDIGLSKAPFRAKNGDNVEATTESLKEQQTMHFFQLQLLRALIANRLYPPRDQVQGEDKHRFIENVIHRLETWKLKAQQLAAADIHMANLWELWYSSTALHLHKRLLQQPTSSDNLKCCYSLSTEIIDISFAELFAQQRIPVTYSWKDICDIILAGVTFLYIISTSADIVGDDTSSLGRRTAKWTTILENALQNWPKAVRAQPLLLSLAKQTMCDIFPHEVDSRHDGNQKRPLKRPKIVRSTPNSTNSNIEVSNLSFPDDDTVDLPAPRTKVRGILARHYSESRALNGSIDDAPKAPIFTHEFVGRNRIRIISTILGLNRPQIERNPCDEMYGNSSFMELVDSLYSPIGH